MQDVSFVYAFFCLPQYVNGEYRAPRKCFDSKRQKENPSTFTSNVGEGWQKTFLLFNYIVIALEIPTFKQPSTWVRKIRCQTNICEGHCQ